MILSWAALALGVIGALVFAYRLWWARGEDRAQLRMRLDALTLSLCGIGSICGVIGLVLAV